MVAIVKNEDLMTAAYTFATQQVNKMNQIINFASIWAFCLFTLKNIGPIFIAAKTTYSQVMDYGHILPYFQQQYIHSVNTLF